MEKRLAVNKCQPCPPTEDSELSDNDSLKSELVLDNT